MRKKSIFIILIIIFLFSFLSCDDEEKDDIKILITCNDTFSGYYIYNSNNPVGITVGDLIYDGIYYYSKTFDDLDSIVVEATRGALTDTLRIRVYRSGTQVITAYLDESDTDYILELTYEYGDEETTSE